MILTELAVGAAELEARTGWSVKPEGLCKGELCVPNAMSPGSRIDARALADALGMPLLHDEDAGVWALGPESGRELATATAPELELPDLEGNLFKLSSLRGQKVLLLAWASW